MNSRPQRSASPFIALASILCFACTTAAQDGRSDTERLGSATRTASGSVGDDFTYPQGVYTGAEVEHAPKPRQAHPAATVKMRSRMSRIILEG